MLLTPAVLAVCVLTGMSTSVAGPAAEPAVMAHAGLTDAVLLLMVILAVGAAGALAYRAWTDGTRRVDAGEDDLPPLLFHSQNTQVPAQRLSSARRASATQRHAVDDDARRYAPDTNGGGGAAQLATATPGRSVAAGQQRTPAPAAGGSRSGGVAGVRTPSEPLAGDTTLQILPGRLEVVSGDAGMREIRFVRPAGGEPVVTLGRSSGDPPDHVQLRSPAVSRLHAQMRFEDGRWVVSNLSQTNPAVVNGAALAADGDERVLRDGDQLELGDVVLRFRS